MTGTPTVSPNPFPCLMNSLRSFCFEAFPLKLPLVASGWLVVDSVVDKMVAAGWSLVDSVVAAGWSLVDLVVEEEKLK